MPTVLTPGIVFELLPSQFDPIFNELFFSFEIEYNKKYCITEVQKVSDGENTYYGVKAFKDVETGIEYNFKKIHLIAPTLTHEFWCFFTNCTPGVKYDL